MSLCGVVLAFALLSPCAGLFIEDPTSSNGFSLKYRPAHQCPGNEQWYDLRSSCPLTCDSIGRPHCIQQVPVPQSGCDCRPGFYRWGSGKCISTEQCLREFFLDFILPFEC